MIALVDAARARGDGMRFSLTALAQRAGLRSRGHFHQILGGKKPLLPAKARSLAGWLFGGEGDRRTAAVRYFELLASQDLLVGAQAAAALDELLDLRRRHGPQVSQPRHDPDALRYLARWHLLPIRELAGLVEFRADPRWIRERLWHRPTLESAQACLDTLVAIGDIAVAPDGTAHQVGAREFTLTHDLTEAGYGPQVRTAAGELHRGALDVVKASIEAVPSAERHLDLKFIRVERSRFPELRQRLAAVIDAFEDVGDVADSVYQVHVSLVPVTEVSR
ncbi:MAG: TIGR02147 family protein [Myxococcales bacterium]|nr:TIGR02147 family protein [Myxococcales bacterium]